MTLDSDEVEEVVDSAMRDSKRLVYTDPSAYLPGRNGLDTPELTMGETQEHIGSIVRPKLEKEIQ